MSAKAEREFKKRVEATFNAIDKNGTGHVSYITFLSWCKKNSTDDGGLSDETLQASRTEFVTHDKNHNGTIEVDELAALLEALDLGDLIQDLPDKPSRKTRVQLDPRLCLHCQKSNEPLDDALDTIHERDNTIEELTDAKEEALADLADAVADAEASAAAMVAAHKKALEEQAAACEKQLDNMTQMHEMQTKMLRSNTEKAAKKMAAELADTTTQLDAAKAEHKVEVEKGTAAAARHQTEVEDLRAQLAAAAAARKKAGEEHEAALAKLREQLAQGASGSAAAVDEMSAQLSALKAQVEDANQNNSELTGKMKSVKQQIAESAAELEGAKTEHVADAAEIKALKEQIAAATSSGSDASKEIAGVREQLAACGGTVTALRAQLAAEQAKVAAEQATVNEATQLAEELTGEKQELESYVEEFEATSEAAINDLTKETKNSKHLLMLGKWRVTGQGMAHSAQIKKLKAEQGADSTAQLTALQKKLAESEDEKAELEKYAEELEAQADASVAAVQAELDAALQRLAEAESEKTELEQYADEVEKLSEQQLQEEHKKAAAHEAEALKTEHAHAAAGLWRVTTKAGARSRSLTWQLKAAEDARKQLEEMVEELDEDSQSSMQVALEAKVNIEKLANTKLKKQAKQIKEAEEYAEELETATLEQVAELEKQVAGLQAELAKSKAECAQLTRSQGSSAARLAAAQAAKAELEQYIEEFETATVEEAEMVKAKHERTVKESEAYYEERIQEATDASKQLREDLKKLRAELAALRSTHAQCGVCKEGLTHDLERSAAQLKLAVDEKTELEEYVEEFEKASLESAKSASGDSQKGMQQIRALKAEHAAQLKTQEAAVAKHAGAARAVAAQLAAVKAQVVTLEEELDEFQQAALQEASSNSAQKAELDKRLADQAAAAKAREAAARKRIADAEGKAKSANSDMLSQHNASVSAADDKLAALEAELLAASAKEAAMKAKHTRLIAKDTHKHFTLSVEKARVRKIEAQMKEAKRKLGFNKLYKYDIGGGENGWGEWDHKPGKKNMGWEMKFTVDSTGRVFGSNKNDSEDAGSKKKYYEGTLKNGVLKVVVKVPDIEQTSTYDGIIKDGELSGRFKIRSTRNSKKNAGSIWGKVAITQMGMKEVLTIAEKSMRKEEAVVRIQAKFRGDKERSELSSEIQELLDMYDEK